METSTESAPIGDQVPDAFPSQVIQDKVETASAAMIEPVALFTRRQVQAAIRRLEVKMDRLCLEYNDCLAKKTRLVQTLHTMAPTGKLASNQRGSSSRHLAKQARQVKSASQGTINGSSSGADAAPHVDENSQLIDA